MISMWGGVLMIIEKGHFSYIADREQKNIDFKVGEEFTNPDLSINSYIADVDGGYILMVDINSALEIELQDISLEVPVEISNYDRIFLNGFQTGTESREFHKNESIPKLNMLVWSMRKQYGDYTIYEGTGKPGKFQSWTYTYIKDIHENFLFWGSISEINGYTMFEFDAQKNIMLIKKDIAGKYSGGEFAAIELLVDKGSEEKVFSDYFKAIKESQEINFNSGIGEEFTDGFQDKYIGSFDKLSSPRDCIAWTSYNTYNSNISEEIIIRNLENYSNKKIPLDIFQIDDGYQEAVGDWLNVSKNFPSGMKSIADRIKEKGYKAGIWLAPFVCEKKSVIFNKHKDWFLNDEKGKPEKVGHNPDWNGSFYALDFYNHSVREYIKEVLNTVLNDWGFDFIKLDCLYAVAYKHRKGRNRGTIMYEALRFLRSIADNKIILGSGVPLGSAYGLVDYCRVTSNVSPKWEDDMLNSMHYRERNSTINSLVTLIGRRHLNGNVFYNAADAFILSAQNNKLNTEQTYTLFLLNVLFGSLIYIGDNIEDYSVEEMKRFLSMFPVKDRIIRRVTYEMGCNKIEFSIEDRDYIAYVNLEDKEVAVVLEEGLYHSPEHGFINNKIQIKLKPFQSECFIKVGADYKVAGSYGHMFPGCEVDRIEYSDGELNVKFSEKLMDYCEVYIKVPDKRDIIVNGKLVKPSQVYDINIVKVVKEM